MTPYKQKKLSSIVANFLVTKTQRSSHLLWLQKETEAKEENQWHIRDCWTLFLRELMVFDFLMNRITDNYIERRILTASGIADQSVYDLKMKSD